MNVLSASSPCPCVSHLDHFLSRNLRSWTCLCPCDRFEHCYCLYVSLGPCPSPDLHQSHCLQSPDTPLFHSLSLIQTLFFRPRSVVKFLKQTSLQFSSKLKGLEMHRYGYRYPSDNADPTSNTMRRKRSEHISGLTMAIEAD